MILVSLLLACARAPEPRGDGDPPATDGAPDPSGGETTPEPGTDLPSLADALGDCDGEFVTPPEYPNQLARGEDLRRVVLTDPAARCNDGTPAVLYVRAARDAAHAADWVLHLQGGSHCTTYEECRTRWCGKAFYDASKMSSTWTPAAIAGQGILNADAAENDFAGYNQAFFYYCSSDVWQGTSPATLTAADGAQLRIDRMGHAIFEAGIAALEAGAASDDGIEALPPILDARTVLLTGTSGGSVGAMTHVDWLRARWPAEIGLLGVFDAAISPDPSTVPVEVSDAVDADSAAEQAMLDADGDLPAFADASCLAGVPAERSWECHNSSRLPYAWLETPFMVRMDLGDGPTGGTYVAAGATTAEFSDAVAASLALLSARGVGGRPVSVFGPACGEHLGLEVDDWFFRHPVVEPSGPVTLEDAVTTFAGGGDVRVIDASHHASSCPSGE